MAPFHGFARVRCQACADEILVAFSWKRRGICPSCTARRMADTAAHLVADLKKLAASSALAQAICPAQPDLEKCLPQLLATNKTPADWIRWFRQLNLVGAMRAQVLAAVGGAWHEALAELIDAVQPVLDAQPAVRDILCGRGVVTSACLENAFADAGRAIAFVRRVFGTETLRGLVKAAIEKLAATDQLKTTKAAACRLRLAVATIKRCSGPSCTASQVEG